MSTKDDAKKTAEELIGIGGAVGDKAKAYDKNISGVKGLGDIGKLGIEDVGKISKGISSISNLYSMLKGDILGDAYTAGRYVFEFDDKQPVGFVASLDGGHFKSDPMVVAQGDELTSRRLPGRPKFEDITIQVGAAMAPAFFRWINQTLECKPERKSGALVGYDYKSKERARRTFYDALITEIGFPALDAASHTPAYFTVKIAPERLGYEKGKGDKLIFRTGKDELSLQKKWLCSNFTFEIDRFKGDKSLKNAKIESFSVKQSVIENRVGNELEPMREVGRIEMPTLQITFPEGQMHLWTKWWDETVRRGNTSDGSTTAAIRYLSSSKREELMRLDLDGVRLMSLEVTKFEPGKPAISTVRATLTVDRVKLLPGSGSSGGSFWSNALESVKGAVSGGGIKSLVSDAGGAGGSAASNVVGGGQGGALASSAVAGGTDAIQSGSAKGLASNVPGSGNELVDRVVDEGKNKLT